MKLYIIEQKTTFVVAAESYDEAYDMMDDCELDFSVWDSQTLSVANKNNVSESWANLQPSNIHDGKTLRDIAPELFKDIK